jgi:hypothetical protein
MFDRLPNGAKEAAGRVVLQADRAIRIRSWFILSMQALDDAARVASKLREPVFERVSRYIVACALPAQPDRVEVAVLTDSLISMRVGTIDAVLDGRYVGYIVTSALFLQCPMHTTDDCRHSSISSQHDRRGCEARFTGHESGRRQSNYGVVSSVNQ